MADIVERLRQIRHVANLFDEAAVEIEQLRHELEENGEQIKDDLFNVKTIGDQPFGTSHWAGTVNGFPAITLSYHGGASLFYFTPKMGWEKKTFNSIYDCHLWLGVDQ